MGSIVHVFYLVRFFLKLLDLAWVAKAILYFFLLAQTTESIKSSVVSARFYFKIKILLQNSYDYIKQNFYFHSVGRIFTLALVIPWLYVLIVIIFSGHNHRVKKNSVP